MARTLEQSITIQAPASDVWRALTDADALICWFAPQARVVPGAGGSIWMSWGPGMEGTTHIMTWEPGRHLRTQDQLPTGDNPNASSVDFQLDEQDGHTTLRLQTGGIAEGPKGDAHLASLRRGWTVYLFNLKRLVERHLGQPGGQHYATLVAEGASPQELWERVSRLVSPAVKQGAKVSIAGVSGEVVLHEPGEILGLELDAPKGGLLQILFENGMVAPGLFVQGASPDTARGAWEKVVTALHHATSP
jgi:uncharacterized protein YndB with AHSA1/START domain